MSLISNIYTISTGEKLEIVIGDWVDVVPNLLPVNNGNGLSYQVVTLYSNEVGILVKVDRQNYSEVILSPCYIVSNYRVVSKINI